MTEATYHAYRLSWQGCLYWPPIAIEAETDSEAIERARQLVADAAVEIRRGTETVARVDLAAHEPG